MYPTPSAESIQHERDIDNVSACQFMHAFDRYVHCSSAGSKLNELYRYGGFKGDCSQKWQDLKFVLTLKTKAKDVQLKLCKEYFKKQIVVDDDPVLKPKSLF